MNLLIKQANGNPLLLDIENEDLKNHILNPNTYIPVILDQINNEEIYKFYFDGKTDLNVIDAGANIGMFSLYAQPVCKNIFAIEPTPSHFDMLNLLTKKYDNIHQLNCALWKEDGEIEFFLQQNSTANTTISSYGCVNSISVNAKSLQTIIKENNISHIDFIKFDIEGSEFEVVNDEFIKTAYPIIDNWFFELHPHVCPNYEEKKENILSLFKQNGYYAETISNDAWMYFVHK